MRVEAGGYSRFMGWNTIMDRDIAAVDWSSVNPPSHNVWVEFSPFDLHLNGRYKLKVTVTKTDVAALASRMLTKRELCGLAGLTDDEKIAMARAAAEHGPLNEMARSLAKNLLSKEEMLALADLTAEEKVSLAREALADLPFAEAARMLAGADEIAFEPS